VVGDLSTSTLRMNVHHLYPRTTLTRLSPAEPVRPGEVLGKRLAVQGDRFHALANVVREFERHKPYFRLLFEELWYASSEFETAVR